MATSSLTAREKRRQPGRPQTLAWVGELKARLILRIGAERLNFILFVIASGLALPVNLGSRILFSLFVDFEAAIVLSHICGMFTAFSLNKFFVFKPSGRPVKSELFRFAIVNLFSLCQTWIIAVSLVKFLLPAIAMTFHPEFVGHFIGLSTTAFTSYFGHKNLSFARKDNWSAKSPIRLRVQKQESNDLGSTDQE